MEANEKTDDKNLIDKHLEYSLDKHLKNIKYIIKKEALELAEKDKSDVTLHHLSKAIEMHISLGVIAKAPGALQEKVSIWSRVPVILIILTIMTSVFAIFGYLAINSDVAVSKGINGQGFLDIAKIFAGAIVGSASVSIGANQLKNSKQDI